MNTKRLLGAGKGRSEHREAAARSHVLLTLEEVRASGLTAYFFDHGEELLFLDGELFDLRDREAALTRGSRPRPLPRQLLDTGVGIEYGWRHSAECVCSTCRKQELRDPDRVAVA